MRISHCVKLLHEVAKTLGQLPLVAQRVVPVEVSLEGPTKEDSHEWDGVC